MVRSTLASVDTPRGLDATRDDRAQVERMMGEGKPTLAYPQCFVKNKRGRVVADRAANTKALTEAYLGPREDIAYAWDIDDPNVVRMALPGLKIFSRVTRR